MMPAKLQDAPPVAKKSEPVPRQAVGFGKVLNSIQGLQQRLDDFSVDDVSHAEAKAATLIRELSSIQLKLTIVPLIKRAFHDAQITIGNLRDETLEVAALSGLEKYSSLSAVLSTANRLQQVVRSAPGRPRTREPVSKQKPDPSQSVPVTEIAPADDTEWVLGDLEPHSPGSAGEAQATPDTGAVVAETHTQVSEKFHFGSETAGRGAAESVEIKSGHPLDSKESRDGMSFDRRLLDDLIKSYGDFASFSETQRAAEDRSQPTSPNAEEAKPLVKSPGAQPAHIENRERADAAPAPSRTEKPPEVISIVQPEKRRSGNETGSSLNRRDDIDRQLKRIVQDYGEYDLYSHRSSISTKVAGLLAFALLGLLMAAFYLFKTPSGVASHPAHSTEQPEAQPSAAKPTAAKDAPANSATNQKPAK